MFMLSWGMGVVMGFLPPCLHLQLPASSWAHDSWQKPPHRAILLLCMGEKMLWGRWVHLMLGCHSSGAFTAVRTVSSRERLAHAGWGASGGLLSQPQQCCLTVPDKAGLVLFSGSSNTETRQSPGPSAVPAYPSALCHLS